MKIHFEKEKQVIAIDENFSYKTDQPERFGGHGEHPEPFKLFLASLGTCAGIYIKNFCDGRGIDASQITMDQKMKFHPVKKIIDEFKFIITVPSDFPEKYDNALIKAAELCAVKRHLREEISVKTTVVRQQ